MSHKTLLVLIIAIMIALVIGIVFLTEYLKENPGFLKAGPEPEIITTATIGHKLDSIVTTVYEIDPMTRENLIKAWQLGYNKGTNNLSAHPDFMGYAELRFKDSLEFMEVFK